MSPNTEAQLVRRTAVVDPEGALQSWHDLMKDGVIVPAQYMTDGETLAPELFNHVGVYTPRGRPQCPVVTSEAGRANKASAITPERALLAGGAHPQITSDILQTQTYYCRPHV